MSPRKKLVDLVEADAESAAAEFDQVDRGPGPDQAVTHVSIQEDPAPEPEED